MSKRVEQEGEEQEGAASALKLPGALNIARGHHFVHLSLFSSLSPRSLLSLLLLHATRWLLMAETSATSAEASATPALSGSKSARKKEHKRRAVEAYLKVDGDERPSMKSWWKDHCAMPRSAGNHHQFNSHIAGRYRVCWETFRKGVTTKLEHERPAGRPRVFTEAEEALIVKAIREAERCLTFLTPNIIQQEVWHIACQPREHEKK